MKFLKLIFILGVSTTCAIASNVLTLVPTHTNGFERNFNPFDSAVGSFYATDFIYEPLWIFNVWHPDKNFPRLAERVEIAPDFTSVTYQLRQGVKWSDGAPFTADDVVFTAEYARQHPDFNVNIDWFDPSRQSGLVTRVTKRGPYTVTFDIAQPNALAHQSLGRLYPLPKHIFETVDDPIAYANTNPVGTGPFTEVTTFRTTHFKLCRNPNYYQNDQLAVDCLRFPHYAGNQQLWAAARLGKIDWMGKGLNNPEEQFTSLQETNKVWLAPGANTVVQMNTTKPPLNDATFRQALSIAINRQHLLEEDTFGLTSPTVWPVATGPLYASWYNRAELGPYQSLMQYNPGVAAAKLDQAGYVDQNGDGWRDLPDGTPFTIGLAVPSGWTDWFNSVLTMVENFRAINIDSKVEGMDEQKWFERIPTGEFDMYMMWTNPGITPWKIYNELFDTSGMQPGNLTNQAMHQFSSPEAVDLLNNFTQTGDPVEQRRIMANIQKIVAENMPVLSLFANPIWYEYSTRRFTGWVTEDNPYVRPQVHKGVPERLIHVLNLKPVN